MAKITLLAHSLRSSLFRTLFLAKQLAAAGHQILVLAPADVEDVITQSGFEFRTLADPWLNPFSSPLPRPSKKDILSLSKRRARAQQTVALYNIDGLIEILQDAAPDLVLINSELHAHIIQTKALGYPVALIASMYNTAPSLTSPPLHHAQVPGHGSSGSKYAVGAGWVSYLMRKRLIFLRNTIRDWGGDQLAGLNHLAKREGVDLRKLRLVNSWQMPWVYRLPTLFLLPKALDLPKKHWPHSHFVGGQTTVTQDNANLDLSDFETFVSPKSDPEEKRVLISFGSLFKPNGAVVRTLFEAVAARPNWRVLFAVKEKFWDQLPPVPANMQLAAWVPMNALMPKADVIVNHGGNATLLEAIDAKLPQLIYPGSVDQYGAGARIQYHNLGILGTPQDDKTTTIDNIEALMSDPSIAASLDEMQQECRAEIDSGAAVKIVEALLSKGPAAT